jgi:hypothetical protein
MADTLGGGSGGALKDVLPPAVAAKVAANPTLYPNLAAVLGQKQTKVTPRKPLDYLIAAAHPFVAAAANMMMGNRSDRKMNFFTGLASGGLDTLAHEAGRTDRMKTADRLRQIEDILLQKTVRGAPISGVEPGTTTGVYKYPGTGETVPGIAPRPPNVPVHPKETREFTDKDGNKVQLEFDQAKQAWVPSMQESGQLDASGKPMRVPIVSPKQAEKPLRELRVGSDIAGAKKGSADDQYYWVEQGKKPVPSGLYRSVSDRPTREGDINRAEKHQVNKWAVKALADAHQRLGPKAKPEEYTNEAVETFRKAAGTSPELAQKSSDVATAIHTLGRNIKSGDELAQLVQALMGDQTKK